MLYINTIAGRVSLVSLEVGRYVPVCCGCRREGYDGSDNHRPAGSFINVRRQKMALQQPGYRRGRGKRDGSRGVGVILGGFNGWWSVIESPGKTRLEELASGIDPQPRLLVETRKVSVSEISRFPSNHCRVPLPF